MMKFDLSIDALVDDSYIRFESSEDPTVVFITLSKGDENVCYDVLFKIDDLKQILSKL